MDTWRNLHNNCQAFGEWLVTAERIIGEWQSVDLPLSEAKAKQKDLEKQVTMKHRYSNLYQLCITSYARSNLHYHAFKPLIPELKSGWQPCSVFKSPILL
jgi:hypothetical protein